MFWSASSVFQEFQLADLGWGGHPHPKPEPDPIMLGVSTNSKPKLDSITKTRVWNSIQARSSFGYQAPHHFKIELETRLKLDYFHI